MLTISTVEMDLEIGWAVGLFEGEGSIEPKRLQLKMISEESVRRFHVIVGVGKVYGPYGPYPSSHAKHPYYLWVATRKDEIQAAADFLRPLLSPSFATRLPR